MNAWAGACKRWQAIGPAMTVVAMLMIMAADVGAVLRLLAAALALVSLIIAAFILWRAQG